MLIKGTEISLAILLLAGVGGLRAVEVDPLVIFQKECISCHTESKRKGGLLIDSRESLIKGGDTDAAIVPGKAGESYLVETLFPDHDSHMPPKGQLEPQQIAAIEKWINEGAKWDSEKWAKLNLPEKTEVTRSEMPEGYAPVLAMALSPDGKTLAVGRGNRIEWFQVKEGAEKEAALLLEKTHSSPGHSDSIQSLAFSPDGKRLASGGFRRVLIWDPAKPKKAIDKIEDTFLGRQTALLYLSNPPRLLVADSLPSQLGRLHEIALDSKKVRSFDTAHLDSIFRLVAKSDGSAYATASADKLITIRNAKTHEIEMRLEGHTGYVLAAAFSPEGKRIATAGDDEEIKVWNLETGKKISAFANSKSGPIYALAWKIDPDNHKKKSEEKDPEKAKEINTDRIFSVAESGSPSAFVELNDHEGVQRSTGAKEKSYDQAEAPLFAIAVHPKLQWTFAGGEDGKIHAWDEKGERKQTVEFETATPPVASNDE